MSLVDPARPEAPVSSRRSTRSTVTLSLVLHGVILAMVVVVPLFGPVPLPGLQDTRTVTAFVLAAAVPPVPPPPAAAAPPAPPTLAAAPATQALTAPTPLEPPDRLVAGEPPTFVPGARSVGGVPASAVGGVEGGIDGGVPGPPAVATRPPDPASHPPLRVGGNIRPPRKVRHVAPEYPSLAAQTRTTGTVVLEATISTTGDVIDVRVLRSAPLLDAAAVAAVRQWRYEPPRLNGMPIAVLLTVTVRFGP